jgi:hypothetical protein
LHCFIMISWLGNLDSVQTPFGFRSDSVLDSVQTPFRLRSDSIQTTFTSFYHDQMVWELQWLQ